MFPRLSTLLIAVVLTVPALSATASAQEVRFSGHLQNGESVCYYCPGFDFVLDNTHASLSSTTIDLLPFVGGYVRGVGQWNGSVTSPAIVVTTIDLVPQTFSIGGNASPGNKMKFTVLGAAGEMAVIAVAFHDGFFPVNGDIVFLAPQSLMILGQGSLGGGSMEVKVELPNNAALIGLGVFGQAAIVHGDGTLTMTNSDLKVIG
jgi:hypothetical protein